MIPSLATPADICDSVRLRARARRIALRLTQADLAARSGVPLGTLKRFERSGQIGFATLLILAEALDALDGFDGLFPPVEARTLQEVERQAQPPKRVRKKAA